MINLFQQKIKLSYKKQQNIHGESILIVLGWKTQSLTIFYI
jgi:hypothetical protein